jgi:hypothetical protein
MGVATSTLKREARMASSTERREQNAARQASNTAARIEMQRGLAKKKAEHTSRVLTAMVERLEGILARLEARIAKVKTNGGDTLESEAFVAEAKSYLSEAKTEIALFTSLDLDGEKAQENFKEARLLATQVKDTLKDARESLKDAVKSLKPGRAGGTATTTPTTSTTTASSTSQ